MFVVEPQFRALATTKTSPGWLSVYKTKMNALRILSKGVSSPVVSVLDSGSDSPGSSPGWA